MNLNESEWIWMNLNESEWIWMNWMNLNESEWIWMNLNESGWIWMNLNESGWIWMNLDVSEGVWMTLVVCGGFWMNLVISGGFWMNLEFKISTYLIGLWNHYNICVLLFVHFQKSLQKSLLSSSVIFSAKVDDDKKATKAKTTSNFIFFSILCFFLELI